MHDLQLTSKLLQSLFPLASSTFVGKVKARTSQRETRPELMPVSVAWRASLGALLLLPVWDASPSQGYPPAVCRRYPRDGRGLNSRPPDLEFEVLTARPHTSPPSTFVASIIAKFVESRCTFCKLRRSFGFFCSVNHLTGPLRKHMFTCSSFKGHGLWFVICGFRIVLFVSCFRARRFVIVLFRAIID